MPIDADSGGQPIWLVCPEPRLRRLLRLAVDPLGALVLDRSACRRLVPASAALATPCARAVVPSASAVIVDLDSVGCGAAAIVERLALAGLPDQACVVLISVYPAEMHDLSPSGRVRYLMPPFAPAELRRQLALAESGPELNSR